MPQILFDQLPEDAQVWIFSASRLLSDKEQVCLLANVDGFLDQWGAHNVPLITARDLRYGQFLFVAVDQRTAGPSGCSIDTLVRQMKVLQEELGVELVNHAPVLFRRGNAVERVSREDFTDMAVSGAVTLDTTVFNNTLKNVGEIRAGRWEVPAADSWHAQAFF